MELLRNKSSVERKVVFRSIVAMCVFVLDLGFANTFNKRVRFRF